MQHTNPDIKDSKIEKKSPPVLFVIGLQGSGKTSDARLIAKEVDGIFFEGDDAINPNSWMKWQIDKGLPVFPWQAKAYINNDLVPALINKRKEANELNKPLIVSQALFTKKSRELMEEKLVDDVNFLIINTTFTLQVKQIKDRGIAKNKSKFNIFCEQASAVISYLWFQNHDSKSKLKVRMLDHLGKGFDEKFIENFKKLDYYASFIRHKPVEKVLQTHATVLAALPKTDVAANTNKPSEVLSVKPEVENQTVVDSKPISQPDSVSAVSLVLK